MEDNLADSGSRITRSLRKRLTSLDTEISSRPSTPTSIKLPLISEISSSPSKLRPTRRSSISGNVTPVKTPAKRVSVVVENLSTVTPVRRSTRRSSVTVTEKEEAGQTGSKVPKFDALNEETIENDEKKMVVTRSKSRSPQGNNNLNISVSPKKSKSPTETKNKDKEIPISKKRKPGPKSKTLGRVEESQEMSDVEISIFEDAIEEVQDNGLKMNSSHSKDKNFPMDQNGNLKDVQVDDGKGELLPKSNFQNCYNLKENKSEISIEKDKIESDESLEICQEMKEIPSASELKENSTPLKLKENDLSSLELRENPQIESVITFTSSDFKKVEFATSPSNDTAIKNVYPKTPGSAKTTIPSNEFNTSLHADSFQEATNLEIHHQDNEIDIIGDGLEITQADFSPTSDSNQNSTLINNEKEDLQPVLDDKEDLTDEKSLNNLEDIKTDNITNIPAENAKDHSTKPTEEELTWTNPSVKGKSTDGSKLDAISADATNSVDNADYSENKQRNKKNNVFTSEDVEEVEENDSEEELREKLYFDDEEALEVDNYGSGDSMDSEEQREIEGNEVPVEAGKIYFDDEEALEVDNYESGDSMDSEEQREIEENEVPVEAESIGSQTTDDDQDIDAEDEDSSNSFIVSDNEDLECTASDEDGEIDGARKKQKIYKRLQVPSESSSSSEAEAEEKKQESVHEDSDTDVIDKESSLKNVKIPEKLEGNNNSLIAQSTSSEAKNNSSDIETSVQQLHSANDCKYEEAEDEEETNKSRQEIIRNLNKTELFNKSVRNLSLDSDKSPTESPKMSQNEKNAKSFLERHTSSSPVTEDNHKAAVETLKDVDRRLGEVSGSSESESDTDEENKNTSLKNFQKASSVLSVSFGNYKRPKRRQEWQRSFTIDVAVKDGELETAVINKQLEENESSSLSSTDNQENEENKEDIDSKYIENIKLMPLQLGNPLIRTRRQSLALPANPDMEIGSSHTGAIGKKENRRSLGLLSKIDFKPSQSFIESLELQKDQRSQFMKKRKRLSKSFSGTTETHDVSIIDIDAQPLRKRSKLSDGNSLRNSENKSTESINSKKLFNHNTMDSYNKHILARCDEILQSANEAKLEDKMRNKKKKNKISKKQWKRKLVHIESEETSSPDNDMIRRIPEEAKLKDNTKKALSQALMAAEVILNKSKINTLKRNTPDTKQSDITDTIDKAGLTKEKCKKDKIDKREKTANICTTSTGKFMEFPQTPQKKKIQKYIQLPTGKVSVEPITPKKSMQVFNGISFRESPLTPHAVGFKITKDIPTESNKQGSSILRTRKRKRSSSLKESSETRGQWTQSGVFTEEEISNNCKIEQEKTRKRENGRKQQLNVNYNFKENAMMRPEINRITKQEMFLLKNRNVHNKNK